MPKLPPRKSLLDVAHASCPTFEIDSRYVKSPAAMCSVVAAVMSATS
ncbi:hypothetical protein [Polyangium fumosum]|nr:hypothetical protein [Polyangium fumosum]